ncbi:MAG: hypothetical protein AAF389_18425 [Gemmatimonadota bacterium]
MRIDVPKFPAVITFLTGLIATVLAVVAALFTESHPMYMEGAQKLMLSWSARELGQGLACFFALFVLRDARAVAVALFSSGVREVVDFVDFFRVPGTPLRLYFVVGISSVLHSAALVVVLRKIRSTAASWSGQEAP